MLSLPGRWGPLPAPTVIQFNHPGHARMSLRLLDLLLLLSTSDQYLFRDSFAPAWYNLHSDRQADDGNEPVR